MKELIEKLNNEGMLWFFLGSNISSTHLISEKECESAMCVVNSIRECLDDTNLDSDTKDKVRDFLVKSEEIINQDMANYKTN